MGSSGITTTEEKMALKYDYTKINSDSWTKEEHNLAAHFCWDVPGDGNCFYVFEVAWQPIFLLGRPER